MRITIACLMFVAAAGGFAQGFPSYDAAFSAPKTVVDYFLLCSGFRLDDGGRLAMLTTGDVDPGDFDGKKNLLTPGYTSGDFSVESVLIDVPNAYIKVSGQQDGLAFTLTVVYFDRKGKSNIPAFSYYSEGGDGDTYICRMYEIDQSRHWRDVTQDVLPGVTLEALDNSADKPDVYPEVDWEYVLPRKGTTVHAVPHMTYEMSETASPKDGYARVKGLLGRALQLPWDRGAGRFSMGAVK